MVSTFNGLEMAKRALSAQQAAMYTTSHNISNANTEGYTRQRVNFQAINGLTSSREPGGLIDRVGNGVEPGSIERIREQFLDVQYRKENAKTQYYSQRAEAANQMEAILNEPSEEGLSHIFDQFWNSLQDLSVNPEDSGARSVVAQRAQAVADTFNYISNSLESVRDDLKNEMDVKETEFNSLLNQINQLNRQIGEVEPHGHVPNDLYDERDRLLDQLSSIADISVSYEKSSGMPSPFAMGKATVKLKSEGSDVTLVDGSDDNYTVNQLEVLTDANNNVTGFTFTHSETGDVTSISAENFKATGQLKGLMEMNGYETATGTVGVYTDMLENLDTMAEAFVEKFNATHAGGYDLNGDPGIGNFFVIDTAATRSSSTISVNEIILDDKDKIAASSVPNASGDGLNAVDLAASYTDYLPGSLGDKTSVKSYFEGVIGELGVVAQEAYRMEANAGTLRQQVSNNRDSVSRVSLDEEMTNLIKFQHAYNAAARSMTTVDEMLDRIINNLGLVGR
ncbi:flagellar hook-associated protein 1 [Halolactibacillus miurensis]|uniref:Flagellar hook-associated protein 1 n=1 Tax=Halolactibacillus miurensis TaxID=306541 RepID=A0A1I6TLU2_9BACI|nr:flagellar hook-associated protein FlgK [Halolactibacillus miurensis]GEM04735.1 flagellar hook-associated protein 1 [Halolactibacillus miurensis]SFS90145.1 flagellar hook-associated protein 1 FlgK [Halolactibacillus miurensis]